MTIPMEGFPWNSLLWGLSLCPWSSPHPIVWLGASSPHWVGRVQRGHWKDLVSPYGTAIKPFRNWMQDLSFCFLFPSLSVWDVEITSSRDQRGSARTIPGTCFSHSCCAYWPCCLIFHHTCSALLQRMAYFFYLECEARI